MQATGVLSDEHHIIERVLGCLDSIVEQEQGKSQRRRGDEPVTFLWASLLAVITQRKNRTCFLPWRRRCSRAKAVLPK